MTKGERAVRQAIGYQQSAIMLPAIVVSPSARCDRRVWGCPLFLPVPFARPGVAASRSADRRAGPPGWRRRDDVHVPLVDTAIRVKDADALAGLAGFDDHPRGPGFEIGQGQLGQFL